MRRWASKADTNIKQGDVIVSFAVAFENSLLPWADTRPLSGDRQHSDPILDPVQTKGVQSCKRPRRIDFDKPYRETFPVLVSTRQARQV